jgi:hypothetical protein
VDYKSIGVKTNYSLKNSILKKHIDSFVGIENINNIEKIIQTSLAITSKNLNFSAGKNDNDPNNLIISKKAHCVGYASFFATTCNYLLQKNKLSNSWTAKPHLGQIYFLGINVHHFFQSPFFKDHDFVIIENKKTGDIYAVDPTISDYLSIDFITCSSPK